MLRIYTGFQAIKFYCFPPPPPPPPNFNCFPPPPPSPHFNCFPSTITTTFFVFYPSPTCFIFSFSTRFYKRLPTAIFSSFCSNVSCSEQQSCFFQLLADCPAYQRQFLLKAATPQQLHALVHPEENKRILLLNNDALLNLARPNVPYKTKKRVLVQEGSGFIEGVLAPVVSSLGFLML